MKGRIYRTKPAVVGQPTALRGFEDILLEHCDALWAVALRLCSYNVQDAQDTLQDAILRAFRASASLEQVNEPYAWLHRILTNTFLNRVRDNRNWNRRSDLDEAMNVAGDSYDTVPSMVIDSIRTDIWNDDIDRALESLSPEARTLFLLSDIEGYTHEELGTMFGLPKGTVSARIYRARKKLAATLEDYAISRGFVSREVVQSEHDRLAEAMALCPDGQRREQEVAERFLAGQSKHDLITRP